MTLRSIVGGEPRDGSVLDGIRAARMGGFGLVGSLSGICAALILTAVVSALFPRAPSQGYVLYSTLFAGMAAMFGRRDAQLTVAASGLAVAYYLLEGAGFAVSDRDDAVGLILLIFTGLLVVFLIDRLRERLAQRNDAYKTVVRDNARQALALAEFRHRVLNDLSSLSAIALLQAARATGPEARESLERMGERICIFSDIYRHLSDESVSSVRVDLRNYLASLCEHIRRGHFGFRPIALTVECQDGMEVLTGEAVLIGLAANEMVANALKYAFPGDRAGEIKVVCGRDEAPDFARLTVEDDGVGSDGTVKGTGLGTTIIRAMASQLAGTYSLTRHDERTRATLRFKPVASDPLVEAGMKAGRG